LEDKIITTMYGNIILNPIDGKDYIENIDFLIRYLKKIEGVEAVSWRIKKGAVLVDEDGDKFSGLLFIVDPVLEAETTIIDDSIVRGNFLSSGQSGEIILGSDLTEKYRSQKALDAIDVDFGDKVVGIMESYKAELSVRGIYQSGFALTDQFIFMGKDDAKEIFSMNEEDLDRSSFVVVKVQRGAEEEVIFNIKNSGLKSEFEIVTWEEKLGIVKQFEESISIISDIISIIGVFISLAIIYILILINVMQKRSQIGILKSIGIEGKTISFSYVIQSFFYGVSGVLFGIVLTLFVVEYFVGYPLLTPVGEVYPIIGFWDYFQSFFILIFSSIIAGYFASRGVIKDKILEAIFNG